MAGQKESSLIDDVIKFMGLGRTSALFSLLLLQSSSVTQIINFSSFKRRAVGGSENPGVPGGYNLFPMVEIGLLG